MGEIRELITAEWERLDKLSSDVTVWDAFVSLVKDRAEVYLLILEADLEILRFIADGYSVKAVARLMDISTIEVNEVIRAWGFLPPLGETLDFNPLLVYNVGMSAVDFMYDVNDVLPIPITLSDAETIVLNIERYKDLERLVEENAR